jgi:DNA-binding PadR family transcriptional regulator
MSWGVESWANIKPGSIYHGLATLAQRGDLVRHDLQDGSREVAVYELSEAGRAEFRRLYEVALTEVRPTAPLAFQTALSMLPLVTRDDAKRMLRTRLENLDAAAGGYGEKTDVEHIPPHVLAVMDYWERVAKVEREWLVRLLFRIEDGELDFLDEPMRWTPAEDDPGHQMQDDRERYLALLRR